MLESFSDYLRRVSSKRRKIPSSYNANGLRYKSFSAHCVRDIFARLSEAEILGDDVAVRSLQNFLASRDEIPAKVLIFHEDYRPGYFGTFTKSSTVVGPQAPISKDAVAFDYSYDSGEDWEEEEEGADDLLSLGGSDVEKSSDVDDDEFDDWLVGDDEPIDPGTPLDERAGSPGFPFPQDLLPKRKNAPAEKESKETKKRKVMPLVPFSKGPCLETNIGECEYEPFNPYRIQLFNGAPISLPSRRLGYTNLESRYTIPHRSIYICLRAGHYRESGCFKAGFRNSSTSSTHPESEVEREFYSPDRCDIFHFHPRWTIAKQLDKPESHQASACATKESLPSSFTAVLRRQSLLIKQRQLDVAS